MNHRNIGQFFSNSSDGASYPFFRKSFSRFLVLCIGCVLASCRNDATLIYPDASQTGTVSESRYRGMYVLNEGNMGSNKATLDFLDLKTGVYSRNIYPSKNPSQILELGDVGNDIKIYGNSLWMVVNQSNKVEVANAHSAISRGHVTIPNCRYLAFQDRYAYISSYVGLINHESVLGAVYKVDTLSLQVVDTCIVGYQPEEMAVVGSQLYVANSGGYNPMQGKDYDRTVSVIDLKTFKVVQAIDVAPNLFRVRADRYGNVWVSSRGNYADVPSRLYEIYNNKVVASVDVPVNDLDFIGDSLIYQGDKRVGIVDIRTGRVVNDNFLSTVEPPFRTPYGLIADCSSGNIYVMDATNYVSSGRLYCFDRRGKYLWSTWTGDIPGHACFLQ